MNNKTSQCTHIFYTAFLTVFICSHCCSDRKTPVRFYWRAQLNYGERLVFRWKTVKHKDTTWMKPQRIKTETKSQINIFTRTQNERQSSYSPSVLSDLFSPFVVCCFKNKVFCACRSQSKHHWTKNNLSWDLERRETETLDFTQAASLQQHLPLISLFSPPPLWFTAENCLRQGV